MGNIYESLVKCPLFKGFSPDEIESVIKDMQCKVSSYAKGQAVAFEDDECTSVGIILDGGVDIQKIYPTGKVVTIEALNPGHVFGEVILFSGMKKYPASIIANSDATILFISREDILKLCSMNQRFLNNIMGLLSNKILTLNRKIKNLSFQTVRQKIANFILEEYKKQKSATIFLPFSRKEIADLLGIPRPSLSRELAGMKDDGVIDFYKNSIKILAPERLEEYLVE